MLNKTFWFVLIVLLFAIFELLRRKVLREKYAMVWLFMALALIVGALFPNLINSISKILGFQYLSNFILFFIGIINLLIGMQLSLSIGKSEDQIQSLAEEIALLSNKVEESN